MPKRPSTRTRSALLATLVAIGTASCASLSPDVDDLAMGDTRTQEHVQEQPEDRSPRSPAPSSRNHPPAPAAASPTSTSEPSVDPDAAAETQDETAPQPSADAPGSARPADRATEPSRSENREPSPPPVRTDPPATSSNPPTPAPAPSVPANFPTAATTGTLSDDLAPLASGTYREHGAVISDVVIAGDVLASGNNMTFRNVRVEGQLRVTGTGTTVEDSDIGALVVSGARDFTARRLNVFGSPGKDGLHVTSDAGRAVNVLIEASRIHSPMVTGNSHYDGIQVRGVDGLTLRGNSFELGPYKRQFTAAIFLENANGGNKDVTIERNYIDGGGYAVYLGGTNTVFTANRFGSSAKWGPLYPRSNMDSVRSAGNIGPDGRPIQF